MPRTIQEILEQQEELAAKFENFDPTLGSERSVAEYLAARQLTQVARITHAVNETEHHGRRDPGVENK